MMARSALVAVALLVTTACSREDVLKTAAAGGTSYNTSTRDNIIKNWQAKVFEKPECTQYRERFKVAGAKYDSAANGAFQADMQQIWDATKKAGCGVA